LQYFSGNIFNPFQKEAFYAFVCYFDFDLNRWGSDWKFAGRVVCALPRTPLWPLLDISLTLEASNA
jgi:hypothetical protein